VDFGNKGQLT